MEKEVSEIIKELRDKAGLRYEEIAAELGCGRMTVHLWEHGSLGADGQRKPVVPREIYREALMALYREKFGREVRIAA